MVLQAGICAISTSASVFSKPLLRWDAYKGRELALKHRCIVSRWPAASGVSLNYALTMKSVGTGGAPTLQVDSCRPHVQLDRKGNTAYGWFETTSSVSMSNIFTGIRGATIVVVARLDNVLAADRGGKNEKVCFPSFVRLMTSCSLVSGAVTDSCPRVWPQPCLFVCHLRDACTPIHLSTRLDSVPSPKSCARLRGRLR